MVRAARYIFCYLTVAPSINPVAFFGDGIPRNTRRARVLPLRKYERLVLASFRGGLPTKIYTNEYGAAPSRGLFVQ